MNATASRIIFLLPNVFFFLTQALLLNLQCHVFPKLTNYTFVFFDLGLTSHQRAETERACGCTLLRFPFEQMPEDFHLDLTCYTWKPLIIEVKCNRLVHFHSSACVSKRWVSVCASSHPRRIFFFFFFFFF